MEVSVSDMIAAHQKLGEMLTVKLAPVPKQVFFGDRKPTLDDYYRQNDASFPEQVPRALSLPFLFQNFNDFASNNFLGRKFDGRFDVVRATWYWSLDTRRSFSRRCSNVLVNFLLAGIVAARPHEIADPVLYNFLIKFICAFHAYNIRVPEFDEQEDFLKYWYTTRYDLIDFSSRNIKKILKKVKAVKNNVPPHMPFKASAFLDQARFQDRAVFGEYAVAWAIQWFLDMEAAHDYCEDVEKTYSAEPEVYQDALCASMAGIGMNELPAYLTPGHFARPELQALYKEIEVIPPSKELESIPWLEPKAAAELILNSDLDSDLSAVLEKLSL